MKSNGLRPASSVAGKAMPIMPPLPPREKPVVNPLALHPRFQRIMASVDNARQPAER